MGVAFHRKLPMLENSWRVGSDSISMKAISLFHSDKPQDSVASNSYELNISRFNCGNPVIAGSMHQLWDQVRILLWHCYKNHYR